MSLCLPISLKLLVISDVVFLWKAFGTFLSIELLHVADALVTTLGRFISRCVCFSLGHRVGLAYSIVARILVLAGCWSQVVVRSILQLIVNEILRGVTFTHFTCLSDSACWS